MSIEFVKIIGVEPAGDTKLRIRFSNGRTGVHDFSAMLAESGPMLEPLRDGALFQKAFVDCGALAWPNGFDIDPTQLHAEMKQAEELLPVPA